MKIGKRILGHKFGATIEGLNLPTPTTPSTIFSTRKINYTYVYSRRRTITPVNSCFQMQREPKPIPPDPPVYKRMQEYTVKRSRKKFTILSSSGIAKKNGRDYASRRVTKAKKGGGGPSAIKEARLCSRQRGEEKRLSKSGGIGRSPTSTVLAFFFPVAGGK